MRGEVIDGLPENKSQAATSGDSDFDEEAVDQTKSTDADGHSWVVLEKPPMSPLPPTPEIKPPSAPTPGVDFAKLAAKKDAKKGYGHIPPSGKYVPIDSGKDAVLRVGKFSGQRVSDIARTERKYLEWMVGQDFPPKLKGICRLWIKKARMGKL